jgi:hypothetical protein
MKRVLLGMLLWLTIVPFTAQVTAQEEPWESGCDEAAQGVIAPIMGQDLYTAGCDALDRCSDETPLAPMGCEFPVYEALLSLCVGEACVLSSSFHMASLMIFEQPPDSIFYYDPTDVQAIIADTLLAFQAGDYQAVIDAYEQVSANRESELGKSPFQDFIVGLMVEALGDLEAAAEAYRASIELFRMPFVTAQRAQVLIQLEHEDAAAAEALLTGDYPVAEALLAEYPLPDDGLESWVAYPVARDGVGGLGLSSADYTVAPGIPIQIVFLSDGSVVMLGTTETIMLFDSDNLPDAVLFYPEGNDYVWNARWSGLTASLTFEGQIGLVRTNKEYGDLTTVETEVLVAPADAPDPRGGQDERCEGGARWRLTIDDYGAASQIFGEGTPYYDAAGGEVAGALNIDLQTFRVVDGPVCIDSQAWWEIDLLRNEGETYWLPEAEAQSSETPKALTYLVYPTQFLSN